MLEILNVPETGRHGEAKMNASTAYRGSFCYIQGFDNDGYTLLALPQSSAQALRAIYVANKLYFAEDLNDTSDAVDKIASGATCLFYDQGEFITDKWVPSTFGFTAGYWNAVQNLSSTYGSTMYYPGGSTAQGNFEKHFCWVATGNARAGCNEGYLIGTAAGTFAGTGADSPGRLGYAAIALGFYYESSASAKLRFRILPGVRPYKA